MSDERNLTQSIRDLAFRAFGEDDAERWLNTNSRFFNGRTPLEMIWSQDDADCVMDFIRHLLGVEDATQPIPVRVRDR